MRVTFGDFVLDLDSHQLLARSGEVHLSPKAFELLKTLVESRPRALAKADLQEILWPATFVVEANLPVLVGELRAALGDSSRAPRFIRTVHGFGYAFAGEAIEVAQSDRPAADKIVCWVVWHRRQFQLVRGDNVIGRDPTALVSVDLPSVSRQHARIVFTGSEALLEDLHSKNGTFLRGERVTGSCTLQDGDEIRTGSIALTFRARPARRSTETLVG